MCSCDFVIVYVVCGTRSAWSTNKFAKRARCLFMYSFFGIKLRTSHNKTNDATNVSIYIYISYHSERNTLARHEWHDHLFKLHCIVYYYCIGSNDKRRHNKSSSWWIVWKCDVHCYHMCHTVVTAASASISITTQCGSMYYHHMCCALLSNAHILELKANKTSQTHENI